MNEKTTADSDQNRKRVQRYILALVSCAIFTLPIHAEAAKSPDLHTYTEAFAAALVLEKETKFTQAITLLAPLAKTYPQDYLIHLQLGWLAFSAEDYKTAQLYYRKAVNLSEGSIQSLMGLGLSHLKLYKRGPAIRAFRALLAKSPNNKAARDALKAAKKIRKYFWAPAIAGNYLSYPGSEIGEKSFAVGLSADLTLHYLQNYSASLKWKYAAFAFLKDPALQTAGRRSSSGSSYVYSSQNDIYADAGYDAELFGARLHYGNTSSPGYELEEAHVGGLTLRFSPFGDMLLHTNHSYYADAIVGRIAPSWKIPLGKHFNVELGGALQRTDENDTYSNLKMNLSSSGKTWDVWVGGKYGDEFRPAYLDYSTIYNMTELIRYGGWGGLAFALDEERFVKIALEWSHLQDTTDSSESDMYFISIGLGRKP
ncbi:hypothetical protein KAI87_04015 [Myxococcota bacterium]|nr:hypothetical protein [Myxococcota bacterium]